MSKYGDYEDEPVLAELYDLVPGYQNRPDLEFYLPYAAAAQGRVLDVGCGTGRILIPVAENGGQITGLDVSEHMLARCRHELQSVAEDVRDRVKLVQADMTSFSLDDLFHLAIVPLRGFQHAIRVEDQLACLRNINRSLVPGGKLVVDVFQVNMGVMSKPPITKEVEDFGPIDLPGGR